MKPLVAVYIIALTCGLTHSYSVYGGNKRYNKASVVDQMTPIYTQQAPLPPQYIDKQANTNYVQSQPRYLSLPYTQPRIADDYNYNSRNPNPSYFYSPRQDYQSYGTPTYRGDYQPKPYYFAQPSYSSSDDHIEATNPLDYLHEEILQENERERSMNNAAFMQNLALYNKQVDSLHSRQQQLQQLQDLYNLKNVDPEDYDIEQPSDWYDQTSVVVDPNQFDDYQVIPQALPLQQQQQYQYQARPSDYDDEMVKELRDLTKHNRKQSGGNKFDVPSMKQSYGNQDWQQDMPQEGDDVTEPEYDDDSWINWDQKRSIQPKKDYGLVDTTKEAFNKLPTPKPSASTQAPSTSTQKSKIIAKLHKGQKEVVLPRPATPVRKPFTEPIMKMMAGSSSGEGKPRKSEQTPPIYKTIKQIIDMEQNLSHVSWTTTSLFFSRPQAKGWIIAVKNS